VSRTTYWHHTRSLEANGAAVIAIVLGMHITQAVILLLDSHAVGGIALAAMLAVASSAGVAGAHMLGVIMLGFAGCTIVGVTRPGLHPIWRLALMLPQQALLTIAAWGAVEAIWRSAYADGVLRSAGFILADQLPLLVILMTHTVAIVRRSKDRRF
jgi:hypothetical protein